MHRFPVCPAQLVRILPTVVSSFTDGDHTRAHIARSRCVKRGRTEGLQQEGGRVEKVGKEIGLHEFCCH